MGRKRKLPADYAKEYTDFEATPSNDLVVCKFCRVQVCTVNGKGALRIAEHQSSNRHIQLKKPRLETGIPLHQTYDGPLDSLFCDKCPAARTMPSSTQMYRKYLPEVYEHDLETIKEAVKNRPISLTIDETPELHGRPEVAVLVTFYDDEIVNPNVKAELPYMFEIYKHLFTLVVQRGHDITQLEREFLAYQAYAVKEIVEPL
ncbi:hypothetical protein HPB47_019715 [Ixodes persulcatus]|uniref:Uncharacterized protein n=1 Tax=Ixodes persulcatus TaxID=34615 RepID=A0AC60QL12_IXOPE|nr:hypothetical protein HPB47_019715 [Ixodes persulcatus]